jgi:regulator of protease activity HflC (stomatin/prohibitin superfamily)
MIREFEGQAAPGLPVVFVLLVAQAASVVGLVLAVMAESVLAIVVATLLIMFVLLMWFGLFIVNPNEARVLQLFGRYTGTVSTPGLRWANPFLTKRKISLKVRNFETEKLKINDANSNPIETAAVVVWKVVDTAEAMFEVDDYQNYVHVQSEAALRNMATDYPYDAHKEGEVALASHTSQISEQLRGEVQDRLGKAGVEVIESRISHLAYSPEIAHAMLQRQQASAVIAARRKIVEGAVGMVDMALELLAKDDIVHMDEERQAAMVSNLLVVLCSDRGTQPVVNTGTIYQ